MSSELETRDLSGLELQTAVKRAIHELRETNPDLPVTVHPSNIQSTIDDIAADKFEASSESGFFGQGSDDERFEPDIPAISFGDIGGLEAEKHRLREAVTIPVKYNQTFRDAGYSVGQGILLHGPPGNGKTMLAKAVANELDYHFLSVKGPELEQPFVGESERQVRELFKAAHEHVPSVIFFDEFDSLAPDRATDTSVYKDDLVNTLLSELDGLEPLEDVIVMAATNRLDRLDPAVLRSGRFDTFIEIPKPDRDDQQAIFELHTTSIPLDESVSADWFGTLNLPELSGADIETICRKALEFAVTAFDAGNRDVLVVTRSDIRTASDQLRADTTRDDLPEFR